MTKKKEITWKNALKHIKYINQLDNITDGMKNTTLNEKCTIDSTRKNYKLIIKNSKILLIKDIPTVKEIELTTSIKEITDNDQNMQLSS